MQAGGQSCKHGAASSNGVVELSVEAGHTTTRLGTIANDEVWKTVECEVGADGLIALTFVVTGPKPKVNDDRDVYIGCLGIAFCPARGRDTRLKILEAIALNPKRMGEPPQKNRPRFDPKFAMRDDQIDPEWYVEQYPDVRLLDLSAEEHYRWIGKRLGRLPNRTAHVRATERA